MTRLLASLLFLSLAGCASESRFAMGMPDDAEQPLMPVWSVIGTSVQQRDIRAAVIGTPAATADEVVLVVGGIHGNEQAGIALAERLLDEASRGDWLGNRHLVVVPVLNPDGVASNTRRNARNVDLNRNWPSTNRIDQASNSGPAPLSEPESAALAALIEEVRPDRVLTLHQPLSCVDWDGPAESLARRMSAACGLPAKKLGGRPGSMGSYLGLDLGTPIITLELPRSADQQPPAARWTTYGPALRLFVEG
ncbi:MAG: DUF2817 domain-containing protein [Planctomycetota bacterium]